MGLANIATCTYYYVYIMYYIDYRVLKDEIYVIGQKYYQPQS